MALGLCSCNIAHSSFRFYLHFSSWVSVLFLPFTLFGNCHHTMSWTSDNIHSYCMEESVLLGTRPLVDCIHHLIRDPSGVFSVCHLCKCRIVQWRHDSRLLLLLNWFLHIIKRTLQAGSKIWILCSREILFLPLEHKIHIFSPPCNILYLFFLGAHIARN